MEFDMSKLVEEIVMQAKENEEEFIFETIHPYCENVLQMKINKEELKQILLNGMKKQEPCEDCISRQAVLDKATSWDAHLTDSERAVSLADIMSLPSVTSSKWIPVSERLPDHPENNDYYLVTILCEHHSGWDNYVTGFAEWTKYGWDIVSEYIGQIKVVAWMPLPESYEESEDEE